MEPDISVINALSAVISGTVAESPRILPVTVTPESVVANLFELLKNNETAPPDKAVI